MKRIVSFVLALATALAFAGCNKQEDGITITEFEELLNKQPMTVFSTQYLVQDNKDKEAYPDLLEAVVKNNTTQTVTSVEIAYMAWNLKKQPVQIKSATDTTEGAFVQKHTLTDIHLLSGRVYGRGKGLPLSKDATLSSILCIKAIVVSFETQEGQKWENPYYSAFETAYSGQKFDYDMRISTEEYTSGLDLIEDTAKIETLKQAELDKTIKEQNIGIIESQYLVQSEDKKNLYPDMLQIVMKNNTEQTISNVHVAFAAWDKNKRPVKIRSHTHDGIDYIDQVTYSNIDLAPGESYGKDVGYPLMQNNNIAHFKAIIVSYETTDGNTWENPYFSDFCELYEQKDLMA